jgi:pimeloyl-ACP methyl ester carboxylesterase
MAAAMSTPAGWPRKAVAWLLDYLFVSWWQLRSLVARHVPERYAEGARAPVVLLPGVYETWLFLRPVADRLSRDGHPVHVVRALGHNRSTVPDAASAVLRLLRECDLRGVVLVAHSKGGLVGTHLLVVDDTEGRVDRLVAVNTPFAGSVYARYVPVRAIRAFSPAEPTLAMLAARSEVNVRITSIFSEFDPHIPGGSALEGATNIRLPLLGHFRPLASRLLIDTVAAEVGRAGRETGHDASRGC